MELFSLFADTLSDASSLKTSLSQLIKYVDCVHFRGGIKLLYLNSPKKSGLVCGKSVNVLPCVSQIVLFALQEWCLVFVVMCHCKKIDVGVCETKKIARLCFVFSKRC